MTATDEQIHEALTRVASRVPEPRNLRDGAIAIAHHRRRRMLAATSLTIAAVAGVAVVGVAVAFTPISQQPSSVSSPAPTMSPSATATGGLDLTLLYRQSMYLAPLRGENDPTYVLNGRLWYGRDVYVSQGGPGGITSGEDVVVPRSSNVGWMAQATQPQIVAGWFGPMGGEFKPFPHQDTSNPDVFAASPGGGYIAMGASLLNRHGRLVGALPANVDDTQAWTPSGLVYKDASGHAWIWSPGGDPVALASTFNVNTEGWGIVTDQDCSTVYRLADVRPVEVFQHCGLYPLQTLSPGWAPGVRLAVASNGDAFDTSSGDLVQHLDIPPALIPAANRVDLQWGGWWRGNTDNTAPPITYFSYSIHRTSAASTSTDYPMQSFIVGCDLSTGNCGRLLNRDASTPGVPFVWR